MTGAVAVGLPRWPRCKGCGGSAEHPQRHCHLLGVCVDTQLFDVLQALAAVGVRPLSSCQGSARQTMVSGPGCGSLVVLPVRAAYVAVHPCGVHPLLEAVAAAGGCDVEAVTTGSLDRQERLIVDGGCLRRAAAAAAAGRVLRVGNDPLAAVVVRGTVGQLSRMAACLSSAELGYGQPAAV